MFNVGDIVRCVNSYQVGTFTANGRGVHVTGLMNDQRFIVSRVINWQDGSQSLFVCAEPRTLKTNRRHALDRSERGPYSSVRFSLKSKSTLIMNDYDPTQQGDTDDDI